MVSGLYVHREYNVDKSYKDYQNIYRIVDDEKNTCVIDYDIAAKLKNTFPEIKGITPVLSFEREIVVKSSQGSDNYITIQNLISTENDFFTIFQMDFLAGDPQKPFTSDPSVILTKSAAEKLFGRTDIIGEQILVYGTPIPVTAVIRDMPENSSLKTEVFVNSEKGNFRFSGACRGGNSDCFNAYPIFASVGNDTDIKLLEEKINSNFPENYTFTNKIRFQPLADIYFDKTITDSNSIAGSRSLVFVFISIALVILILSVINYVNFTLSQQLETLKQLGIKMVNGASMKQLRLYYIMEISLSVFLSFILSLIICALSLPIFDRILDVHLSMTTLLSPLFILSMILVLLFVILISTLTPFYIISRFDIQMLFGKRETYFGRQWGKMILTGCQMAITVIMFICLFMVQKQLDYVKNYDLGFDKHYLVGIDLPNPGGFDAFKSEVAKYNFVQNMVYSNGAPGSVEGWEEQPNEQGQTITIKKIYAEPGFIKTFDIQLLQGRNFTDADCDKSCIIAEETMKQMDWDNIEGKKCNGYEVIGIYKDFNVSSLHHRMEPVNIICTGNKDWLYRLNVRFTGNVPQVLDQLRQAWKTAVPGEVFRYKFYDEVFDAFYRKEERQSTAIAVFSVIAIVITCMGLIGQVMRTSLSKAKEIGIRKINGATIKQMMLVIPGSFLKCFAVAFVVAIPVAWYAMTQWLQNFAFKTTISWWIFALSGLAALFILSLSVLLQTWKAATANPAEVIKME